METCLLMHSVWDWILDFTVCLLACNYTWRSGMVFTEFLICFQDRREQWRWISGCSPVTKNKINTKLIYHDDWYNTYTCVTVNGLTLLCQFNVYFMPIMKSLFFKILYVLSIFTCTKVLSLHRYELILFKNTRYFLFNASMS